MSRAKPTIDQIQNLESELNSKQNTLVSGINIKTINGTSILGSGDIDISGSGIQGFAVQDNFVATAGQTVFILSTSATGVSIVAVNGIQQKPITDYSISGTTLTFTYALTLNDEVVVTYGTNLASPIGIEDQIIDGVTNLAPSQNAVYDALQLKQDNLVSGTNIKTINGTSILGSGDLVIDTGAVSLDNYKKVENLVLRLTAAFDYPTFYVQPQGGGFSHYGNLSSIPRSEAFLGNNKSSPIPKFHLKSQLSANSIASYSSLNSSYLSFIEHYGGAKFALHMKFGGSNSNPDSEKNYIGFFGLNQLNNDVDSIFGGTNNNFQHNLSNAIGVGWRTTDTNLQIIYLNASDVITFIDLGSNFKAPPQRNSEYYLYELIIKRKTNDLNVFDIIITDINTGNTTTNTITTKVSGLESSGIVMAIKKVVESSLNLHIALGSVELYKWYD